VKVLGLTTEGDSGAVLVDNGSIVAAINEERLSRLKLVEGIPRGSIREVLRLAKTPVRDLDGVVVASHMDFLVDELVPFEGWFTGWKRGGTVGRIKRAAGRMSRYRNKIPLLERAYYLAMEPGYRRRERAIRRILREEFGVTAPITFMDHHLAHCTSAYYTSGFDDALVISLDGGGDAKSSRIYAVRDGEWEQVHETSAYDSLGNYYAYVTHICGFVAHKHEGKVTGLAAHGEPKYLDILRNFIDEEGGRLINRGGTVFQTAIEDLQRALPPEWKRADLAASIQVHTEELVRRYVGHWARETRLRDLAVAGGVFANVRVNEEVLNLPEVDRLFVFPHMGDGGLGGGAALAASCPGILPRTMRAQRNPLRDVYLGVTITERDAERALRDEGLEPESVDGGIEAHVAELLAQGYVVARATGRMEYGPRALGNRSVLYQPADPSVNQWLNDNLRRTEFMPFAPALLWEERDRCFENLHGGEHAAEFMTITAQATPWMKKYMPGVVHLDGTARPQLVREDRNPGFYRIIAEFRRRTGLPAVINTSFNMHEEPIVCTAHDAVRGFLDGKLDYLILGSFLIRHPAGVSHPLRPVTLRVESASGRRERDLVFVRSRSATARASLGEEVQEPSRSQERRSARDSES
jgi:carbamoyltransferase